MNNQLKSVDNDNIFFKKYLNYKKKYNLLKNQYAGKFTIDAKRKVLKSIFHNEKLFNDHKMQFYLLIKLLQKLELNIDNCPQDFDPTKLEFKICDLNKKFDIIPSDKSQIIENYGQLNFKFKTRIAEGAYGKVYNGKINIGVDYNSLIKVPIKSYDYLRIDVIKEAFINICIINDIILKSIYNNLVFTIGLLFLPECDLDIDPNLCKEGPLNINLIQSTLPNVKTLFKSIKSDISLFQFINYLKEVLNQLSELEESSYGLIHGDLHAENILISNNKAYIIDWGQSSFLYEGKRLRSSQNNESNYFSFDETGVKKSGLKDIYHLLSHCRYNASTDILSFINQLINKIFIQNDLYFYKNNIITKFTEIDINRCGWLYNLISGSYYEGNKFISIDNFTKEIYDLNQPIFDKYSYREILSEIIKLEQI